MERQLTIRLPADLAAKLERSAKRLKRKRSEVVREALEQYLDTQPDIRPIEQVRDLLGSIASGRPDLGQRHRDYLIRRLRRGRGTLVGYGCIRGPRGPRRELHDDCIAELEKWTGHVVTTEAVLTETLYLVGPGWRAQKICLEFILRGAFQLVPSSAKSLHRVAALMEKYRNVPMDFADGTLGCSRGRTGNG